MRTVTVSTQLPAPAEAVWSAATRNSDAFRYITRGLIRFPAARAWDRPLAVGDRLHGWLFLFGVVPLSRHTITVAEIDQDQRRLVTDERGGILRSWRHTITADPVDAGTCRYRDQIDIDAGPLTLAVAACAHLFYRVRQRRWHIIARFLSVALEA